MALLRVAWRAGKMRRNGTRKKGFCPNKQNKEVTSWLLNEPFKFRNIFVIIIIIVVDIAGVTMKTAGGRSGLKSFFSRFLPAKVGNKFAVDVCVVVFIYLFP